MCSTSPFSILFSFFLFFPLILSQDIAFPNSSPDVQDDQNSHQMAQRFEAPALSLSSSAMSDSSAGGTGADNVDKGVTQLALNIHKKLKVLKGEQNWAVYSPTSIASAIYMLLLGSNGKTFNELCQILGINPSVSYLKPHQDFSTVMRDLQFKGKDESIIKIANALFLQNSFAIRQEYVDAIQALYQASLYSVDFRNHGSYIQNVVNTWVSDKTEGKITEMLAKPPPPDTDLILLNSLYFKGEWATPFPTDLTREQYFYPDGRDQPSKYKIPMMANQDSYHYHNDPALNCEIVAIPYKGEQIVFYLIVPKKSNKQKLKSLEDQLTTSEINRLISNLKKTDNMIVAMPKIKIESEFILNPVLQQLGLNSLFDPREADLSLLASTENVKELLPTEDKDSFVFTRMKKFNDSEDRPKRQVKIDATQDTLPTELFKSLTASRKYLPNPGLYVNKIIHKVVVDINEIGTEAAAVTGAFGQRTLTVTLKADAPYLFLIRHEPTKMVLFWSSVNSPPRT